MGPGINAFHSAAVAPALGLIGYQIYNENPMPQHLGAILLLVALLVFVYHASLFWKKYQAASQSNDASATTTSTVEEKND